MTMSKMSQRMLNRASLKGIYTRIYREIIEYCFLLPEQIFCRIWTLGASSGREMGRADLTKLLPARRADSEHFFFRPFDMALGTLFWGPGLGSRAWDPGLGPGLGPGTRAGPGRDPGGTRAGKHMIIQRVRMIVYCLILFFMN